MLGQAFSCFHITTFLNKTKQKQCTGEAESLPNAQPALPDMTRAVSKYYTSFFGITC